MKRTREPYFSVNLPRVMGIINLTPDSFFAESRLGGSTGQALADRVRAMVDQGADILDLGAESSRPGAEEVSEAEELRRLIPALELVRSLCELVISVDTRRPRVAEAALAAGADIINDIAAGRQDDQAMLDVAARHDAPLILMHMRGQPKNMQQSPHYDDVVAEVREFLRERIQAAENRGVRQILIDPGIGFGKTLDHNLQLLAWTDSLASLGRPVLVGHSRKQFIGQVLAHPAQGGAASPRPVEGRMAGGLGVAVWCALQGAAVIRTHDVAETVDALRLVRAIRERRGEVPHV